MKPGRRPHLALMAFLLIDGAYLHAHDFWLSSTPWQPHSETASVTITGNVGDTFPVATERATPAGVETWRVIGPRGPVASPRGFRQQGQSIATTTLIPAPGSYLGVMTVRAREMAMSGKEFTDYLQEEGLEDIIAERRRLGQVGAPARERYARYAKVVVRKGDGASTHVTRPVGLKAEFVPAVDPSGLHPGDSLTLQFLVEGKPVGGVLLSAVSEKPRIDARTDADGRVTFTLPRSGPWLIKTVYMTRPAVSGSTRPDWESYWVTLSFHVSDAEK